MGNIKVKCKMQRDFTKLIKTYGKNSDYSGIMRIFAERIYP